MPAEFQNAIDPTLTNCTNTYAYLDDILIVTKRSLDLHKQKLQTVLKKLDEENLAISLDKCKFACKQVEWLGSNINSEGTKPLMRKTEAIEKLSPLKFYEELKKLYGLHTKSYTIYTKIGTNRCRFTSIAKEHRKKPLDWSTEHKTTFKNILKLEAEITQNKHFDQHLDTRIVCDASTTGLGVALEQDSPEVWVAVAYALRFLNSLGEK